MANAKDLKCSRSNFWKLLHNPVYCGYVSFSSIEYEERQLVKGIHEPIITTALYYQVQKIIDTKRRITSKKREINEMFVLRKYLICPACNRKLLGSFSQGRRKKYPYYHCQNGCKIRFRAQMINDYYENYLKEVQLLGGAMPLFELVLKDSNVNIQLGELLKERSSLLNQIKEHDHFIAKARKAIIDGRIEPDDFSKIKSDYLITSENLNDELNRVMIKLNCVDNQTNFIKSFNKIIGRFKDLDINDKKYIIDFIPPVNFDIHGSFSLSTSVALSKILYFKKQYLNIAESLVSVKPKLINENHYFKDRRISVKKAMPF